MNTHLNLSQREQQVLNLIAYEHNTKEIADKLLLSPHTITSYRRKLMSKMRVRNIAGMVRVGYEYGLLPT